jgi:hypothetical protein
MNNLWNQDRPISARTAAFVVATAVLLLAGARFEAQVLDICGCASVPGLQPFDSTSPATYPAGTSDNGSTITMTLPPDGIFRFSSFRVQNRHVAFARNAANSPVTILVAGDASLVSTGGCCFQFVVSGATGSGGSSSFAGVGGASGPGGFRGGDAASQGINGAAIGGAGFGPGGGAGATASPFTSGGGGTFLGLPELIPLVGGSGGGGGASTSAGNTSCSGGGGGGGGGAVLIAANGTLSLTNYQMYADGGGGAGPGNGSCSSSGGGGSGGAIRLVANRLAQAGNGDLLARGVNNGGSNGRIRLESVDTSAQTQFSATPPALRIIGPTPLANPINPTVIITSVGGAVVPAVPQGTFGAIDVVLPAPGATPVAVSTTGVPSGTTVEVTVKPRIGGPAVVQTAPLSSCSAAGACDTVATFNLAAGAYVVEARATFQIQ